MTHHISNDAEIGLRSLNRATAKVYQEAIKNQKPIPIWVDGQVVYKLPTELEAEVLMSKGEKP